MPCAAQEYISVQFSRRLFIWRSVTWISGPRLGTGKENGTQPFFIAEMITLQTVRVGTLADRPGIPSFLLQIWGIAAVLEVSCNHELQWTRSNIHTNNYDLVVQVNSYYFSVRYACVCVCVCVCVCPVCLCMCVNLYVSTGVGVVLLFRKHFEDRLIRLKKGKYPQTTITLSITLPYRNWIHWRLANHQRRLIPYSPDSSVLRTIPALLQGILPTSTAITITLYSVNFFRPSILQDLSADGMILCFPLLPLTSFASAIK